MDNNEVELVMLETDAFAKIEKGKTLLMLPPWESYECSTPPLWLYIADKHAIELKNALVKIYGK